MPALQHALDKLIRQEVTEKLISNAMEDIQARADKAKEELRGRVEDIVNQIEIKDIKQYHSMSMMRDDIAVLVGWKENYR